MHQEGEACAKGMRSVAWAHAYDWAVSKSCERAFLARMIKNESQAVSFFRPLLYVAAMMNAGLLLPFVWLREDQSFWTNAGGYPLWLRDLVLVAYYPLLLLYGSLLAYLSWLWLCRPARSSRLFCVEALVLTLLWVVLALVAVLMLSNNIANLIDGRPLHAH
jgi:hypothetical protein